ncbi:MAG TPA: hypothetical protein VIX73_37790 [Kofleriaceae bacterium]
MDALARWAEMTQSMRDNDGRPLGEARAAREQLIGVPLDMRRCPYPGSRHEHERPMNLSALRQVSLHWRAILGGMNRLRVLHCARAGQAPPRIVDVWRIGNMTTALADFAFLRTWQPVGDRELPAVVAALYKISLGVTSTCAAVWADGFAALSAAATVPLLYEYAEDHGQLIGPAQVCGGSAAMIKELLAVVHGREVDHDGRETRHVIGDERRFAAFCDDTAALRLLRMAFERMDVVLRRELLVHVGEHMESRARARLEAEIDGDARLDRFARLGRQQHLVVLDDLLGQIVDERFSAGAELASCARRLRAQWTAPVADATALARDAVAASAPARRLPLAARTRLVGLVARDLDLEIAMASVVKHLKRRIADTLGIEPGTAMARERGLIDFEPRRIRPAMRSALRDAFGIEISAAACRVVLRSGDLQREASPDP